MPENTLIPKIDCLWIVWSTWFKGPEFTNFAADNQDMCATCMHRFKYQLTDDCKESFFELKTNT